MSRREDEVELRLVPPDPGVKRVYRNRRTGRLRIEQRGDWVGVVVVVVLGLMFAGVLGSFAWAVASQYGAWTIPVTLLVEVAVFAALVGIFVT